MRPTIGLRSILLGVSFVALTSAATLAADTTPPSDATPPAAQPQETTTPATTPGTPAEAQPPADTSKDKEVVCKKLDPPTGSHMGGKRVCRTVAEWRAMAADAKTAIDGMQASSRADTPDAQ